MSHILNTLFYLLCALLFIFIGTIGILIPWSVEIRTTFIQFLFEESTLITILGSAFALIGLFILVSIIGTSRRYLKISINNNPVTLDEGLIQKYMDTYWKELFPHDEVESRFLIKRHQLQVYADLPYIPKHEQKPFSDRIGIDLGDIVHRLLGYPHEVVLFARYQKEKAAN